MKYRIIILLFLSALLFSVSEALAKEPSKVRAVSLRVLQGRVKVCQKQGVCKEELLQLVGLKKISGYAIDEKNRDLILIGPIDGNLPSLYLEDFVVALRNVWIKYSGKNRNTYFISDPACSIDPDPLVIQRLRIIGEKILGSSSEGLIRRSIEEWNQTCQSPQRVRVLGIPFHNHFAWVMVNADYDMKRLVDGSEKINLPGFTSLNDLTLERAKRDIQNGQEISIPVSSMNRFWFSPGENYYKEDKGVVIIEKCPVILLTEEEHLNREGRITGGNKPSPLAKQFCEIFSAKYTEVAQRKSIYTELENLFQWLALAKIFKFKSALTEAGLDLDFLFNHYQISRKLVKEELPGRSHVKEFKHRQDFSGGYQIAQLWLPSCGGVGMDIKVSQRNFTKDTSTKLASVRTAILKSRPSPETLFWDPPIIWRND